MPERVAAHALRQPCLASRRGNRPLNRRLVQMKSRRWPETRIAADASCGKDELPAPLGRRVRELSFERRRHNHAAEPLGQISLVTGANFLEVLPQLIVYQLRQHDAAVLLPLAATDGHLTALEIEILDPQLETLLQAQARAAHGDATVTGVAEPTVRAGGPRRPVGGPSVASGGEGPLRVSPIRKGPTGVGTATAVKRACGRRRSRGRDEQRPPLLGKPENGFPQRPQGPPLTVQMGTFLFR